ncbi:MAG: DUF4270 domain-containing protein [Flavobacteriales bacterium]|nr:DUF4270 domain-containing protein [Flavobacteriales bacterium]
MSAAFPHRRTGTYYGLLAAVLCMALFQSCRKPEEDLGLELLPGAPLGLVSDTTEVEAFTFADSAVQTSGLSRSLVGSYVDPDFGLLKASLVAQLRLTANSIGQGQDNSGLVADSIVLALAFETPNTHYGNLDPQHFMVQELSAGLSIDSVYRSDRQPAVLEEDLVALHGGEITPNPFVNAFVGDDTLGPQVRIPLKLSLAERFLDAFGTSDLADNTSFLEFFKGIKVSVSNPSQLPYQGGILHINTIGTGTKVTVYYHDELNQPELGRTFDLLISTGSVRYNAVERDRSLAVNPGLAQALADPDGEQATVFLQTLGGYRTAVRFPELLALAGQDRIVSKAELIVPLNGSFYPYYAPPPTILLFRDNNGADAFLPDQLAGVTGIGGDFSVSEKVYRFNITRYVQQVMNGTLPDDGIMLVAGSSGVSANRAVICGPDHPSTPMRLLLTFTTY